jgi:hypothetical protein
MEIECSARHTGKKSSLKDDWRALHPITDNAATSFLWQWYKRQIPALARATEPAGFSARNTCLKQASIASTNAPVSKTLNATDCSSVELIKLLEDESSGTLATWLWRFARLLLHSRHAYPLIH